MKIKKFLIKIGWFSELLITIILINFSYFFIFTNLDRSDKILLIAVLILMFFMNITKIPLATATIYSQTFFYKLLFVIALIFVTFASFETYFQVFELYIVNKHPLINLNEFVYFVLSFIFAIIGIIFAMTGLYLTKLEEIKNYEVNKHG